MLQTFYRLTTCFFTFFAFSAQAGYTTFQFDGLSRQYIYYAPANLPANEPLLFVSHGFGGSGSGWNGYFNTLATQNKFAIYDLHDNTADNTGLTGILRHYEGTVS
jgi:polyhydroxybutyrate depolymerase